MTECSYVSNSLLNTCVKSLRLQAKVPQPNGMPAKCLCVAIPAESKKEAGEEEKPSMGKPETWQRGHVLQRMHMAHDRAAFPTIQQNAYASTARSRKFRVASKGKRRLPQTGRQAGLPGIAAMTASPVLACSCKLQNMSVWARLVRTWTYLHVTLEALPPNNRCSAISEWP